jgi:hypothetical protein
VARLGQLGVLERHHVRGQQARLAVVLDLRAALHDHHLVVRQPRARLLVGLREHQRLDAALEVLEQEARHAVALLGLDEAQRRHQPAHAHFAGSGLLRQGSRRGARPLRELGAVALERVAGDEEAERLLLERQPLGFRPGWRVRHALAAARGRGRRVRAAEEARLPRLEIALALLPALHGGVDRRVERRTARVEPVESAALDEALDHATVHGA